MKSRLLLLAFALGHLGAIAANETPRERLLMDPNWRFAVGAPDLGDGVKILAGLSMDLSQNFGAFSKAGSAGGPAAPVFNDLSWRRVELPHDWAVEMPFSEKGGCGQGSKAVGPNFPSSSVAWYRRTFTIPAGDTARRVSVEFDGVFRDAEFYCNGHYLGRHFSGYVPVSYDLSPYLEYGGTNTLAVKVNATSYEGWFYEGAGIYRHVWLVKTAPVHVPVFGTYVTSTVTGDPAAPSAATVVARTTVRNDGDAPATVTVPTRLLDASGKQVAAGESAPVSLAPGKETEVAVTLTLAQPRLWSTTTPYLYQVESQVKTGAELTDRVMTPIGIRTIRWDAEQGFFLNGVRTFLKGTCNHQDHAGVGVALPDRVNVWRLERLVEMGCNAYRASHNPPTPELLDACDRLGILVMDENRTVGATDEALSQLEKLIRRDRNHPSVVIWSLGNEEFGIQGKELGARIITPMQRLAKELDPTRPTTLAMNNNWGSGFSKVVDVQGCNYHQLSGGYDNFHKKFPNQPIVGSEDTSHTTTRGVYREQKDVGYSHADEAQAKFPGWGNRAEDTIKYFAERPYAAGFFAWTGFDYRGEPTPYHSWPSISSHFGILDTCGFPKDLFYYYQAQWTTAPMIHLLPHWNWPDQVGQPVRVRCDSNAEEVELFLNGASQGRKPMPKMGHLEWTVTYQPGTLEAKGYAGGKLVSQTRTETTGTPAAVRLSADRTTLNADGEDVAMIAVAVTDAQGRAVPTAGNLVSFKLTGPGRIIGVGNGDPLCHEPDQFVNPAPTLLRGTWTSQVTTESTAAVAADLDDTAWPKAITDGKNLTKGQIGVWRGSFTLTAAQLDGSTVAMTQGAAKGGTMTVFLDGKPIDLGKRSEGDAYATVRVPALSAGKHVIAVVVTATDKKGGLSVAPNLVLTPAATAKWQRSLFNGLAQIIVQTQREAGPITLTASAEGLQPTSVTLTATPATLRPVAP